MGIKQSLKNKLRRLVMWAVLLLIILLIFLSIYGAFAGAERAKVFFNSLPLTFYWVVLVFMLVVGFGVFGRLVRAPGLLLIHLGVIVVLLGGMAGSERGHEVQRRFFGIDKIQAGSMVISEGESENLITSEKDGASLKLPFSIRLKDFRIEYYKPDYLRVQTRSGDGWKIPVEVGVEYSLGENIGKLRIVRAFENFKITIEGDKRIAVDHRGPGINPAVQVEIRHPDGSITSEYVFERFPNQPRPEDKFLLSYRRIISDYISDLEVIEDGKVSAEKSIEVNKPLHFGGYH
ncbi:MAG: cytochrome c biogenesis protein ResB, partial [Planctomycetota bacterium]